MFLSEFISKQSNNVRLGLISGLFSGPVVANVHDFHHLLINSFDTPRQMTASPGVVANLICLFLQAVLITYLHKLLMATF